MKRRFRTYRMRNAATGFLFTLPWLIGCALFFLLPFCQTMAYTVNEVTLEPGRMVLNFRGLEIFREVLVDSPDFLRALIESFTKVIYTIPVVLVFSMFAALMLSQKFPGRGLARTLFFLPVIISSGIFLRVINEDILSSGASLNDNGAATLMNLFGVFELLKSFGVSTVIIETIMAVASNVFSFILQSGVQILIFLTGIQSIPPSLYEAGKIEGATAWEIFWKITFPMITPMILLNTVYTVIDSFMDLENPVIKLILETFKEMKYSEPAIMTLLYSVMIVLILGIVFLVMRRHVYYTVD